MIRFLLILFLVIAWEASALERGIWKYELPSFGYSTGKNCNQEMEVVANLLAKVGSVEILGSGCVQPHLGQPWQNGQISYSNQAALPIITSDIKGPWGSYGPYSTYNDCLLALEREREIFTRNIGASPFVEYCYDSSGFGRKAFRVHMDAVSKSSRKKFSTGTNWTGKFLDLPSVLSDISKISSSFGFEVMELYVEPDTYGNRITLDYYGDSRKFILAKARGFYNYVENCKSQVEELSRRWPSSFPSTFACSTVSGAPTQLIQLWISDTPINDEDIKSSSLPTKYNTLVECEADRPRVEKALLKSGTDILATLCTNGEKAQSAVMLVLTKRK